MTVLVVGATGSIGRLVVEEAARKGHTVRALARDPGKARRLFPAVEVVAGALNGVAEATGYDLVRQYWTSRLPALTAGLADLAKDNAGGGSNATQLGMGGAFPGAQGIPAGPNSIGGGGVANPANPERRGLPLKSHLANRKAEDS